MDFNIFSQKLMKNTYLATYYDVGNIAKSNSPNNLLFSGR